MNIHSPHSSLEGREHALQPQEHMRNVERHAKQVARLVEERELSGVGEGSMTAEEALQFSEITGELNAAFQEGDYAAFTERSFVLGNLIAPYQAELLQSGESADESLRPLLAEFRAIAESFSAMSEGVSGLEGLDQENFKKMTNYFGELVTRTEMKFGQPSVEESGESGGEELDSLEHSDTEVGELDSEAEADEQDTAKTDGQSVRPSVSSSTVAAEEGVHNEAVSPEVDTDELPDDQESAEPSNEEEALEKKENTEDDPLIRDTEVLAASFDDWETGGFTRTFMTGEQSRAFVESTARLSELLKSGDAKAFNQELAQLMNCFQGYGERKSNEDGEINEDIGKIKEIGLAFRQFQDLFEETLAGAEANPNIDAPRVSQVKDFFAQVDDFHARLYDAGMKFLKGSDYEPDESFTVREKATQSAEKTDLNERGRQTEIRSEAGERERQEVLRDLSRGFGQVGYVAEDFRRKESSRAREGFTFELLGPLRAARVTRSLEETISALQRGDTAKAADSLSQISGALRNFGEGRASGSGVKEDFNNFRSALRTFDDLVGEFAKVRSKYEKSKNVFQDKLLEEAIVTVLRDLRKANDAGNYLYGRAKSAHDRASGR